MARAAGLRWISPDKPGYGGSDYQRKRSLTSWCDDLTALAGHLGLDRFALAGESGGGPFTLAVAHQLASRVSIAALIATGGPMNPAERAGMKARIRVMYWLARNAPALNTLPVTAMRRELASPESGSVPCSATWPPPCTSATHQGTMSASTAARRSCPCLPPT